MSSNPGQQEVRRGRLQRWLQTAAFLGAAAILGMVLYTSFVVQSNRRAAEATVTAAVRYETAAAAVPRTTTAVSEVRPTENWEQYASTPLPDSLQPIWADSADQVEELARWGRGVLNSVAWSPDGSILAVGTSLGVYLYEPQTLEASTLLDVGGSVSLLAFSPDGQFLALALGAGNVQRWSVVDGTLLEIVEGVGNAVAVGFSRMGQLLLVWMRPGETFPVLWWDGTVIPLPLPAGGVTLVPMDAAVERVGPVEPVAMKLSPNGRFVAVGLTDGNIYLWEIGDREAVGDGSLVAVIPAGLLGGEQMAFSPNGRLLAVAAADLGVRVWQVPDVTLLYTVAGDLHGSLSLAFSPDSRTLAAVDSQAAWFYGVDRGALVRRIDIRDGGSTVLVPLDLPPCAAFSPDGLSLAIAAPPQQLSLFDVESGSLLQSAVGSALPWTGLALSPDGDTLAVRSFLDEAIWLWDVLRARPKRALRAESAPAWNHWRAGAFSPDGRLLAVGDRGRTLLWEVAEGTVVGQFPSEDTGSVNPAISPGGTPAPVVAFTATYTYSDTGRYPPSPEEAGNLVQCTAFAPDGRWLATSSEGRVQLWYVATGELRLTAVVTPSVDTSWCSLVFSPDAQYLAVSWLPGFVYLWHLPDGALVQHWSGAPGWASVGVAFSPDGRFLAAWSSPGELSLWPVAGGEALRMAAVPTEVGLELAFSPDGSLLAGGSWEGPIYLWRVSDGALLRVLAGHNSWVSGLAFSSDERLLFSTSGDGTIRVWGVR